MILMLAIPNLASAWPVLTFGACIVLGLALLVVGFRMERTHDD